MFHWQYGFEVHLAHSCNLICAHCDHYSNFHHRGILSVDDYTDWLTNWSKRITPTQIALLGGEPALNPNLTEMVYLTREFYPLVHVLIVSNGFHLYKHPGLPRALE